MKLNNTVKKIGDIIMKNEPVYRVFNSNKTALDGASRLLIKTINCANNHKDYNLIF